MLKDLTKYEQLQFAVFIVFFLAFVVCFALVIIQPTPSSAIVATYKELKTLFLGLLSISTLKAAIAKDNGAKNEKDNPSLNNPA